MVRIIPKVANNNARRPGKKIKMQAYMRAHHAISIYTTPTPPLQVILQNRISERRICGELFFMRSNFYQSDYITELVLH